MELQTQNNPASGFEKLKIELAKLAKDNSLGQANLEYEVIEIDVPTANSTVSIPKTTRVEHKKVVGLFIFSPNFADYKSTMHLSIGQKDVMGSDKIAVNIHSKDDYLSVNDVAFKTDIDVNNSPIKVDYYDGGAITTPYTIFLYLICVKN